MITDQLERALRAADPTTAHDEIPTADATLRAAMARVDRPPVPTRRRRTWVAVGAIVAAAVVLALLVPLLDSRSTPTAQAAIRLAPFGGLMTPYVLGTVPTGLAAGQFSGGQGTTATVYTPDTQSAGGVSVTHTTVALTARPGDLPHAEASRTEPDGTWVTVSGYGAFAVGTTVTALLADVRPAASPLQVALAPSGWQLAAFKDIGAGEGVVTVSPHGTLDDHDTISVIRYRTTKTDFPFGYSDQGPTTSLTSLGRAGILMDGSEQWTLQLRLPDGGSLVLLLPARMDREQVQRFADGVTVPTP